jgi:hypothetical protein
MTLTVWFDTLILIVHPQLVALEKKVEEQSKKEVQKEQQEAEAPMINPGGFGNRLMLTQGNGYDTVLALWDRY